jgi:hypothetical protein
MKPKRVLRFRVSSTLTRSGTSWQVVQQFDEYIYLDQTTALEPLDGKDEWASDADGPEHPDT